MIKIRTYQDLLEIPDRDQDRMDFVKTVINEHRSSKLYKQAVLADEYDKKQNRTIVQYQKLLYTVTGKAVPDNWSANYKLCSGFFNRFITQQVQFLLGNGVTWNNKDTASKLGDDFDKELQVAAKAALGGALSFGFYNKDHVEVFKVQEFAPLYDEENGALRAGVRWWQVDPNKPLRATLYEEDGFTEYVWKYGIGEILQNKRSYLLKVRSTEADGTEIYDGQNYPSFPIVPLWANPHKQSELVGLREQIDAYDLIKSGFCNTVDEASFVYWTINNAGGMDDVDLATFVERMKTVHAAVVEDTGASAQSHAIETPYQSREALLERLKKDMYDDYMALNIDDIKGGADTATHIRAAYEPMNSKADQFEYCVTEFIKGILFVAGIDDEPTFTRSYIINAQEEIGTVLEASQYLSDDYVTRKILTLLGDADKADEVLKEIKESEENRIETEQENEPQEEPIEDEE